MTDLTGYVGKWEGTWKTWLRPNELHDDSPLTAEVVARDGGWLMSYQGSIGDDAVIGSMEVAVDGGEIQWLDSWHTEGNEQILVGNDGALPAFTYGPDDAPWTWSIDITPLDNALVVTHFNAPPGADAVRAVLMTLHRP